MSNTVLELEWERLRQTVRNAVRFLDNLIEVNKYPLPKVERLTRANRKIGLGVMGFAEMLVRLGLSYDSEEAVAMAEKLMRFINAEALAMSQELAYRRGVFPSWEGSACQAQNLRVRNATRTAIAPTSTIGIIVGTSPSIEPLFALAYEHAHVLGEQRFYEMNSLFLEYVQRLGLNQDQLARAIQAQGRLAEVSGVPEALKHLFVTALEIPAERHLQIQAAFQRHVDNSVSKTINLPREATHQEVARAYWRAWELHLKGITLFRYGSKATQVLRLGTGEEPHYYDYAAKCDPEECRG